MKKKPFSLDLPSDMRTLVENGAECVAVEFHETEQSASGKNSGGRNTRSLYGVSVLWHRSCTGWCRC